MNMNLRNFVSRWVLILGFAGVFAGGPQAQAPQEEFKPVVGQPGKDVVWVPTPQVVVDSMLDMARITPQDYVVDLGSGDGRNIISAAKRGARGRGVEYNPDMVALSRRNAAQEGVADRATFVEGDMFAADFSDATALALFLLPDNLTRLRDKFLALKPGTRIVANTFWIDGWEPDEQEQLPETDCENWCRVMLFIVPARIEGTWRHAQGELTITQQFQKISGTLGNGGRLTPIANGTMRGEQIRFTVDGAEYTGRVNGGRIEGTVTSDGRTTPWTATRSSSQAEAPASQN
jgi:SAM-dependent methyltransferase